MNTSSKFNEIVKNGINEIIIDSVADITENDIIVLKFNTSHDWQPSLIFGTDDKQVLGIALKDIRVFL